MFKVIISGILIGIANIIPGVSGATLAVLTNQYNRIMAVIDTGISFKFRSLDWGYLFLIVGSAVAGIYLFSWPLDHALDHYEGYTISVIIGLILGSLNGVNLSDTKRSEKSRYLSPYFFIGLVGITALIFVQPDTQTIGTISYSKYLLSGIVAMIAMIIPGVSGSMILLLMGTYASIIRLIKEQAIIELIPFIGGVFLGGIMGVKIIKWLISRYNHQFESFILGAVIGSVIFIMMTMDISTSDLFGMVVVAFLGMDLANRLISYGSR